MLTGIIGYTQWSKTLAAISTTPETVTARFSDSSTATGTLLIGCDGIHSQIREILCPSTFRNILLPVRLIGVSVVYPADKAEKMRALDPFFLQGGDPKTNVFFWFSCPFILILGSRRKAEGCFCM